MTMFTDTIVDGWLRDIVENCYLSLHFDNPDLAGAYASEVFGGSYRRVKGSFTTPDSRACFNDTDVTWKGLPNITLTHIGGWDALVSGNLMFYGALPEPVRMTTGKNYTLPSFDISLSID